MQNPQLKSSGLVALSCPWYVILSSSLGKIRPHQKLPCPNIN
ncbi:hypothetical protein AO370_1057 [Moraxella catarrhalis]|uniref:Uncharacterized protein n=1 Tax=Moraxella catarrhalis TaxID=480 RepID=A0AB36DPA9_MORCA|nr:hypothetical protein AO370_1057 [Moraxella catarrhalis]